MDTQNGALRQKVITEIAKEFACSIDRIVDCIVIPLLPVFAQNAAVGSRVIDTFECAIDRI